MIIATMDWPLQINGRLYMETIRKYMNDIGHNEEYFDVLIK
jgi:hypothetical protein